MEPPISLVCGRLHILQLVVIWLGNSECSEYDDFEDGKLVVVEQQLQLVVIWLRNSECSEYDDFEDGCHRVCDRRQSSALDSTLQVSQTFAILVVVEVKTEHSLDDW
nr:hypothetical protein [Tanacetum cinerariifolium]